MNVAKIVLRELDPARDAQTIDAFVEMLDRTQPGLGKTISTVAATVYYLVGKPLVRGALTGGAVGAALSRAAGTNRSETASLVAYAAYVGAVVDAVHYILNLRDAEQEGNSPAHH